MPHAGRQVKLVCVLQCGRTVKQDLGVLLFELCPLCTLEEGILKTVGIKMCPTLVKCGCYGICISDVGSRL